MDVWRSSFFSLAGPWLRRSTPTVLAVAFGIKGCCDRLHSTGCVEKLDLAEARPRPPKFGLSERPVSNERDLIGVFGTPEDSAENRRQRFFNTIDPLKKLSQEAPRN